MKTYAFAPLIPPTSLLDQPQKQGFSPRPEPHRPKLAETITPRQRQVLCCLIEGKPTKRICEELGMSMGTAKVHIGAILRALGVRNRTQATLVALREGLVYPEMWSRS